MTLLAVERQVLDSFGQPPGVWGKQPEAAGGVQAPAQVADRSLVRLPFGGQLAGAVLPDGLQRAVPGPGHVRGRDQEALIGEPGQHGRDHAVGHRRPAGTHRHRRRRGERSREHRYPAQYRLAGLVQQGIAPVKRGPQRAMPVIRPSAAGQQVHPVRQPGLDPVQAQRREARGRQLDRQRHAVEPPADGGDPVRVACSKRSPGRRRAHPEQLHRITRPAVAGLDGQPGHREHPLEWHQQPGAAGDQHRQPRAARQEPLKQDWHPIQQVLAVVQDQQHLSLRQPSEDGVLARAALPLAQAERRGDGRGDHGRIGDRDEVHIPGAVGVPAGHIGDHAERQARLADPARSYRGDQAVRGERVSQRRPFGGPADE